MFSVSQKMDIAKKIEELLLEINHPEMPSARPMFHLHVVGAEAWSWADIEPNWVFDENNKPGVNPHNEAVDKYMNAPTSASE